jgi:hypothetical protein
MAIRLGPKSLEYGTFLFPLLPLELSVPCWRAIHFQQPYICRLKCSPKIRHILPQDERSRPVEMSQICLLSPGNDLPRLAPKASGMNWSAYLPPVELETNLSWGRSVGQYPRTRRALAVLYRQRLEVGQSPERKPEYGTSSLPTSLIYFCTTNSRRSGNGSYPRPQTHLLGHLHSPSSIDSIELTIPNVMEPPIPLRRLFDVTNL